MRFKDFKASENDAIHITDHWQMGVLLDNVPEGWLGGSTPEDICDIMDEYAGRFEEFCCDIIRFQYCDMDWYSENGFHIYEFEDFEWDGYECTDIDPDATFDVEDFMAGLYA